MAKNGYDYDLFVIGAGSGGVRAARISAGFGAKVAIAEEHRVGGTCVIRGCVPKKLLVYASHFAEDFEDAAGYGWTVPGEARFDWATLIANKDAEIDRLAGFFEAIGLPTDFARFGITEAADFLKIAEVSLTAPYSANYFKTLDPPALARSMISLNERG